MNEQLRLLWWNVSWQHRKRTPEQIRAIQALSERPNMLALGELNARTEQAWREAFPDFVFADPPASLPDATNRVLLGAH